RLGSLTTCPKSRGVDAPRIVLALERLAPTPSPEGRGRCYWFLSGRFQLFIPRKLLNTYEVLFSRNSLHTISTNHAVNSIRPAVMRFDCRRFFRPFWYYRNDERALRSPKHARRP